MFNLFLLEIMSSGILSLNLHLYIMSHFLHDLRGLEVWSNDTANVEAVVEFKLLAQGLLV